MTEKLLVRNGAPTLAGMKTGSLFTCPYQSREEIQGDIRELNRRLVPKGIRILPLRFSEWRTLLYLYRPNHLKRDFRDGRTAFLLKARGYPVDNPDRCVVQLVSRLRCREAFPHEIGLFLGYPPEDVHGFMEHKRCFKCVGCWKVYGDEEKAKQIFCRYQKCTDVLCSRWAKGASIEELAVVAKESD